MQGLENLMDDHDIKQIEDIAVEYGRIMDWFRGQWPEARIRLEVNSDQRVGVLKYKLTVLTGKEMSPRNQGYFESVITIDKERFTDPFFMDAFKKNLFPNYQKSITRAMNEHYNKEKEIADSGLRGT